MSVSRKHLARVALRAAIDTRSRANELMSSPICVYDLAEALGIEVKFAPGSSFGGMYSKTSNTTLVPALRPPGRQAYTCAHELGHWYFGHGNCIDDLRAIEIGVDDENELLVNMFAGFLLAPPWTVRSAFKSRGWQPASADPVQYYAIACQLGMGYQSIVTHMQYSLRMISDEGANRILTATPKMIREAILGIGESKHAVLVDTEWCAVPIDARVGDHIVLPPSVIIECDHVSAAGECEHGLVIVAEKPGIGRVTKQDGSWAAFLRVSRQDFSGRAIYRHLEDPDVDAST